MGRNHINSNDNGKGADIFNDVPGMVGKAITKLTEYIAVFKADAQSRQLDRRDLFTAEFKISILKRTADKFNVYRENKDFRTADGGSGDDNNADKFSRFSLEILNNINELFSTTIIDNPALVKKMYQTDWITIKKLKSKLSPDNIKQNTIDEKAYEARKKQLKAGDKKLANDFEEWYTAARTALYETCETLIKLIISLNVAKRSLYKQRVMQTMTKK